MILSLLFACADEPDDTASDATCDESSGSICLYAGTGQAGWQPEPMPILESWLYFPMDVEVRDGKPPIVVDWNNNTIRQVTDDGMFANAIGSGFAGDGPGDASDRTEAGSQGIQTALNHPTDASWMSNGELLMPVWHNHKMRTWNPDTGIVHVIAGDVIGFAGDGGPAVDALLSMPHNSLADEDGTIYLVDQRNERIRVITTDGMINTIAGDGIQGYVGDGGLASSAEFNLPTGATPAPAGALALENNILYMSDTSNHRIRAIDLETGIISCLAGNGIAGYTGDGGPAIDAEINNPVDIEVQDGILYIADTYNSAIRTVDLETGIISTFAGTGESGWTGDGGNALEAELHFPHGIGIADDGRLFIADTFNHVIRVVYP